MSTAARPNHRSEKIAHGVNVTLLVATLVVVAIAVPAIWFWHTRSVSVIAQAFIDEASALVTEADQLEADGQAAEAEERLSKAVDLTWKFQQIRGEDPESSLLLAKAFDRSPQGQSNPARAAQLYAKAIANAAGQEQADMQARAAELSLITGDPNRAVEQAKSLKTNSVYIADQSGELRATVDKVHATALMTLVENDSLDSGSLSRGEEPGAVLGVAIESNPEDCNLPMMLASLYRNPEYHKYLGAARQQELDDPESNLDPDARADAIVDQMVERNQTLGDAWLARFRYRTQFKIDGAQSDLQEALKRDPDDPLINLVHGTSLFQQFTQTRDNNASQNDELSSQQRELLEHAKSSLENCIAHSPEQLNPVNRDAFALVGLVDYLLGNTELALNRWSDVLSRPEMTTPLAAPFRQRMIEVLIEQGRLDEAQQELDAFEQAISQYARAIDDPRKLALLVEPKQALEGMLKRQQGSTTEAISVLEQARAEQRGSDENARRVFRELGRSYMELGQPRSAASVYEEAVQKDSSSPEFRYLLSDAHSRAGQFDEAVNAFEPVTSSGNATARDWLYLARLILNRESRKPVQLQNWQAFDRAFRQARELNDLQPLDQPWQLEILDLSATLAKITSDPAQMDSDELRFRLGELNRRLEQDSGTGVDPELLATMARLHDQIGQTDEADKLMDQYESMVGPVVSLYITRAGLLASRGEFTAAAQKLDEGLSHVTDKDETVQLQLAQVNLLIRDRQYDAAIARMVEIVEAHSDAPRLVIQLANLVIQLPDQINSEPATWEARLNDIEGPDGPLAQYLEARRIVLKLQGNEDPDQRHPLLEQASRLCGEIVRREPDWPDALVLTGLVLEMQADNIRQQARQNDNADANTIRQQDDMANQMVERAIRSYRRAFELGERGRLVLLRLAELEPDPARRQQFLAQVDQDQIAGDERLSNLQTTVSIAKNDTQAARTLAEKATEIRSADPSAWLTRARVELIDGDTDAARLSAEQAETLAEASGNLRTVLIELFRFYGFVDQYVDDQSIRDEWKQKARQLTEKIVELSPADQQLLIRAEMLEFLGDPAALDTFRQAAQQFPDSSRVLERALQFFRNLNSFSFPDALDESIQIANRLVQLQPGNAEYRRIQASLLARRGASDDWNLVTEALSSENLDALDAGENERSLAALLFSRTNVTNSERIRNLEEAYNKVRDREGALDLILAGQILRNWAVLLSDADQDQREQKLADARDCYVRAAEAADVRNIHLFAVTEFFIEERDWDQAEYYLAKVQNLTTRSVAETAPAVALAARLMHRRGADSDNSIDFVEDFGRKFELEVQNLPARSRAQARWAVAEILDSIEARERALEWRRKAVVDNPDLRPGLALKLAEAGQFEQAISECTNAYQESGETFFVTAIADILISNNAPPEFYKIADPLFETALATDSDNANLLVSVANARIVGEGRVDDAVQLYEQALKLSPDNELLLNNMATVYAELPDRLPDALRTIDRAIRLYGQRPGLLDTKSIILMFQGDLDGAEKLLREVVNRNSDSRFDWHLAEVKWKQYEKSGNSDQLQQAKLYFERSLEKGLETQILTPGEKQRLAELRQNLDAANLGTRPSSPAGYRAWPPSQLVRFSPPVSLSGSAL